ncbi:MAG: hypothetical protein KBC11_03070 [Candidatus Pacebacteria bacterium]|nr:hypothetical protein [Candidatus Paceibacterota bacterium]
MEIKWEKLKNRQSAKLVFEKDLEDSKILDGINTDVRFATFGGILTISASSIKKDLKEILILKKKKFDWLQIKISVENAIKSKFPQTQFVGTPER